MSIKNRTKVELFNKYYSAETKIIIQTSQVVQPVFRLFRTINIQRYLSANLTFFPKINGRDTGTLFKEFTECRLIGKV